MMKNEILLRTLEAGTRRREKANKRTSLLLLTVTKTGRTRLVLRNVEG